jgi:DHA2 family multidrug resistance protein-like MFS transporter
MLVLGSGRALGPRSPLLWAAAGAAVAAVVAYRRRARRHPAPVLDPRLLGQPAVGLAAILAVVANGAMFVAWLLVPTLVVDHLGLTPVVGGLALAAAPLAMGLVAPTAGRWVDRAGTGRAMTVGLAVEGAGLGMLAAVSPSRGIAPVAAAMALVGVGLGVFAVANMTAIMGALPDDRQGTAGGLALMLRTVGIVGGVAGSAALFDVLEPGRGFVEAYRLTTSASVVVALGGALVAARFIGLDRPGTEGRRSPA